MPQTMESVLLDVSYKSVEGLIYATAGKFFRRHKSGISFDEMVSQANLAFVKACKSYSPEKAKFTTWVTIHIWYHLKKQMQKSFKDKLRPLPDKYDIEDTQMNTWEWKEFRKGLKKRSRILVRLILSPTPELVRITESLGEPTRENVRTALKVYLQGHGWNMSQITMAFQEIHRRLK